MKADRIDNLDRRILNLIMNNARYPSKDIAVECGVSRAAIHMRIQRLIEMKVITGSGYQVDESMLGYNTCTYIGVKLEKGSLYRNVVKELEQIPEVVECHFTTGPYSMLIKVFAKDNLDLMTLLNDKIQHIDGVTETETLISLEQSLNRQIAVRPLPGKKR
ncbi:MAG: Lrp/AsnC ligand binding domain-containing protein [Muribaculaceae bacterium]|nr:Lrp/AsnC ligand binding domain-containing protein [Muribaculaceae bacterium]